MMEKDQLSAVYRQYIDCLNRRDWGHLENFVCNGVKRNNEQLGLCGYKAMLEENYEDIPDLAFRIDLLVCDPPMIAARLLFNCTPNSRFLGLPVNGKRISFTENVSTCFATEELKTFGVEPQQVVLGEAESADRGVIFYTAVGPMPVVSMQPERQLLGAVV